MINNMNMYTAEKYIALFTNELQRQNKKINTVSGYTADIKKFIVWLEETTNINFEGALDSKYIDKYTKYLLKKGFKATTVERKASAITKFNIFLRSLGKSNPINIKRLSMSKREKDVQKIDTMTMKKLETTFLKMNNNRDIAIFYLFKTIGLKVTELLTITLDNLNIDEKYLVIGPVGRERILNLPEDTVEVLKNYLEERPSTHINTVFLGRKGPLNRMSINKLLTRYCSYAEIGSITPNDLRYTFLCRLLDQGFSIKDICKLAGHFSTTVTEKVLEKEIYKKNYAN